jgi:hypothetical protein
MNTNPSRLKGFTDSKPKQSEDLWIQDFLKNKKTEDLASSNRDIKIIKDYDLIEESHQRDLGLAVIDKEDAKKIQEDKQVRSQLLTSEKIGSFWTQEQTSSRLF